METLVLTNKGIEQITAKETEELIKAETIEIKPGIVKIKCTEEELAKLTYLGRTFNTTGEIKADFTFTSREDLLQKIPQIELTGTYAAECDREGEHEFTSFEIAQEIDNRIKGTAIDHKKPQTRFIAVIRENRCILAEDYSGIDLGKRDYRIFLGRESLRGNIAAALLKIADYQPTHTILDPYCRHGVIPIEAALISTNTSVNKHIKHKLACSRYDLSKYDKHREAKGKIYSTDEHFAHVNAAKKNAKIAGAAKDIQFSRQEVEWIDTKFGPNSIDKIVTMPTQPSSANEKTIQKTYNKLFEQSRHLLKKKGTLLLCMRQGTETATKAAEDNNFTLQQKTTIMQGKEELTILSFSSA